LRGKKLKTYLKISAAAFVLASLGAGAAPVFAQSTPEVDDRGIEELVVTATRRSESANKIPLAVQALSGDSLGDLNVTNFEKLVEFLPNVRTASRGPGASSIYIRGLSTDTAGAQIQGTAGASPSVALYVNDAPASLVGRNLDFYAADLQRVEVLAGPQGTLYGASAMGGAVRYITNKPDLNEFGAGFNGSYAFTKGGDNSAAGNAYINIPVLTNQIAVRLVLYNDSQGGYIDNVAGTFQMPFNGNVGIAGRLPTGNPLLVRQAIQSCAGITNCTGSNYVAPIRQSINNDRFVEENYNDANYAGGRIAATFKVNDDWSIDVMHARQTLTTDGVFDYEPAVGDLKVTQFNENTLRDEYNLTTWTVNGRLGFLDMIYTGSYLKHNALQKADYAGYSNIGLYVPYYECDAGVYYANPARGRTCYTPNKSYQVRNRTTRKTHEFRVTTPAENRIRATAGLFYDDNQLVDNTDWSYLQAAAGFIYPRRPNPVSLPNDPSVRPVAVGFFNDVRRTDKQFAIYGEGSFDIIPNKLTITGGLRYYNEKAGITGSSATSFDGVSRGVFDPITNTYSAAATPPAFYGVSANLNQLYAAISPATYTGLLKKGNLTYKINDGSLVYATYSEGFRPGGFNRRPCRVGTATCPTQADFNRLGVYVPDEVKNYEIGGKFSLLNRTLQVNFAAYRIDWTDIQQTLFDQNISNQTFTTNLTDARIQGVEGDITWRTTSELTFNAAFSYNDSEITRYTKPTTVINAIGTPLALSPKFQGNVRIRYEKELASGLRPFLQGAFHHVGSSISSTINNVDIRYSGPAVTYNGVVVNPGQVVSPLPASLPQKAYNTFSLSAGVSRDQWSLELFGENLTDERPELFRSANDGDLRVTTSRPRTIGLRMSYKM
jgi:iron complex outermembrane recepter protein